jgi:type II restriction enzyme
MSKKLELREQRYNTIINGTSKKQEQELVGALRKTIDHIERKFDITLKHSKTVKLQDIITKLKKHFPTMDFSDVSSNTYINPDGGILYVLDKQNIEYPILIAEVKNQGTNDLRLKEGKPKQAQGNAIERLGKNVIGLRTYLLNENIFPFVTFGYGCDFAEDSKILDRVITIAMFGELNKLYINNQGPQGIFNRGSFFFREDKWNEEEMERVMTEIATRSIHYYFSKYGEDNFN